MRHARATVALLLPSLAVGACDVPRFSGPQIQQPPADFSLQPASESSQPTFPDREVVFHTAWVHTGLGGVSVIFVDGHPGTVDMEDVMAAREDVMAAETDPDAVFDEIEALRIDGHDAWGWQERIESPRRGLVEVTYRAVVPYDSVTYAIEFMSGEPSIKRAAPDTLKAVISTFGIGRTTYNIPVIVIALGAVLFVFSVLRTRSRERSDRLRSINLVTIERDEEGAEPAPPPADAERPTGPSPRSGPSPPAPPDTSPRDASAGPPES